LTKSLKSAKRAAWKAFQDVVYGLLGNKRRYNAHKLIQTIMVTVYSIRE